MTWLAHSASVAQIGPLLGRLARWWSQELLGFVPVSWREFNVRRIEAHIRDEFVDLRIHRSPGRVIEGRADLSRGVIEPSGFAIQLKRECGALPVWLFPPGGEILSRIVQVPRSAVAHFEKLLGVEIDRWTPFSSDEVRAAWHVVRSSGNRSEVELRLVPRSAIERWSGILAPFGLAPSLVVLSDDRSLCVPATSDPLMSLAQRRVRRLATASLVAATALLVLIDWAATARERNAWQARVDSERRLLVRQADMERRIDEILATAVGSEDRRGALLASLSSVLPPADWLTEISLRQGTVTLRGYSANVEALLKALGPLSSDSIVTLQGEPTFDARLERRRFTVAFNIAEARPR